MSQCLKHWILWHTGQLSTVYTSKLTCRLIDRHSEIGDDAVTLTDNDDGGSISMTMIFELHTVAVDDEYNFSRYFSIFKTLVINNILHLQISFIVHITFYLLLPTILSFVRIIVLTPRFCTTTSVTAFSLSLFWVIFIHFSQLWTNV